MDHYRIHALVQGIAAGLAGIAAEDRPALGYLSARRRDLSRALLDVGARDLWRFGAMDLDGAMAGLQSRAGWDRTLRRNLRAPCGPDGSLWSRAAEADPARRVGAILALCALHAPAALPDAVRLLDLNPGFASILLAELQLVRAAGAALADPSEAAIAAIAAAKVGLAEAIDARPRKTTLGQALRAGMLQITAVAALDEDLCDLVRTLAAVPDLAFAAPVPPQHHGRLALALVTETLDAVAPALGHFWAEPVLCDLLLRCCGAPVKVFRDAAHAAGYEAALTQLFTEARARRDSLGEERWQTLAAELLRRVRIATLYANPGSLLPLQAARGALLDALNRARVPDYDAPPPAIARTRFCVGFLFSHAGQGTETYAMLAHMIGLDRQRFQVEAFIVPHDRHDPGGDPAGLLAQHAERVHNLAGLANPDRARLIRRCGLDLMVICNSVTWGWSDYIDLAGYRLARQTVATYTAVTTTGLSNVDLWLSATASDPDPDAASFYTERLVRKAGSVLCFAGLALPEARRSRVGRAPGSGPVLISGANFYKLNEEVWTLWLDLLVRHPTARLVIFPFNPNWDSAYPRAAFRLQLASRARAAGVALDRIEVVGPWEDRLEIYRVLAEADLYLDTFPHSGGLSTIDPLLVGTPVVTLQGRYQRATQGADVLRAFGLEGWIVRTTDAYRDRVADILADPEHARSQAGQAAATRTALLDTTAFGLEISEAFELMLLDRRATVPASLPAAPRALPRFRGRGLATHAFAMPEADYGHLVLWAQSVAVADAEWETFSFKLQQFAGALLLELRPDDAQPPMFTPAEATATDDQGPVIRLVLSDEPPAGGALLDWLRIALPVRETIAAMVAAALSPAAAEYPDAIADIDPGSWRPALERCLEWLAATLQ